MATTNGTITSPPPSHKPSSPDSVSLKRKRSESTGDALHVNGTGDNADCLEVTGSEISIEDLQKSLYGILKSYDTIPSILEHSIHQSDRTSLGEPNAKRTKSPTGERSIARQLQEGRYETLDALVEDVESASAELEAAVKTPEDENRYVPPSYTETRLVTSILAFKKVLKGIILREAHRLPTKRKQQTTNGEQTKIENEADTLAAGGMDGVEQSDGKIILTLFAQAAGPRMLFSSLQQPTRVPPHYSKQAVEAPSVDVSLPIQESSLPNIMSATHVVPVHEEDVKPKKEPTFGDVFAPPASIPQFSPPKPPKPLTTRGSTVTWVPEDQFRPSRKGNVFAEQNLATGQWLGYGGVDPPTEPTSHEAKQKSRQRALSMGEINLPLTDDAKESLQQAKADALFRSVYSSFAPSRDDATAVVPSETRDRMWWHKVGQKKFVDPSAIDPSILEGELDEEAMDVDDSEDAEDKELAEVIEHLDPEILQMAGELPEEKKESKEVAEVLHDISGLLETLHSYQRNRNSSLATNPRTPVSQNQSLAELNGTPSSPSSAEVDIYDVLKSQLALMIETLPPYAVAKLNGDQLADLNISRKLVIETKDYRGVMEEDPVSRLASQAMNSASGMSAARPGYGAPQPHQQHAAPQYGRAPPSSHTPAARPNPSAYYAQQQAASRSPMQYHQPAARPQTYAAPGGYAPSTVRPSFSAQPGYNQQTPRAAFPQTPGASFPQQPRPPPQNYGATHGYYQPSPQAQYQPRAYQQPQAQAPPTPTFQKQRPANPAPQQMYPNYHATSQSPHLRTASPLKPAPPGYQQQAQPPPQAYPIPQPRSASGFGTPIAQPRPPSTPGQGPAFATPVTQARPPSTPAQAGYFAPTPNMQPRPTPGASYPSQQAGYTAAGAPSTAAYTPQPSSMRPTPYQGHENSVVQQLAQQAGQGTQGLSQPASTGSTPQPMQGQQQVNGGGL